MYLSDHFTRLETTCKCGCGKYGADAELLYIMQMLRDYYDVAITPTSWFRCYEHNCRHKDDQNEHGIFGAGSNANSWHLTGAAVDFKVSGVPPISVYQFLRELYPQKYGIGVYDTFTHLDMRPVRADWILQTQRAFN